MQIRLKDYLKAEERGASSAVARALADMKDGDTLLLSGQRYDFYKDGASEAYYYISNNDKGKKTIVFPLLGKKNITVDGEGAELIFHGEIMPFVLDGCENVVVKNLSIDYASPMYVQAEIVESEKGYMELAFDGDEFKFKEEAGKFWIYNDEDAWKQEFRHCLVMEVDKHTKAPSAYKRNYITETEKGVDHGFLNKMFKNVKYKALGYNRLAVYGDVGDTHQKGNYWVGTFHYNRKNPGIFINASKNVTLENINLYHTLAMGVICQISENITLKNMQTKLREGSRRLLTVCADATHFVNCRGKIVMKDCFFTNMLDDALNIHGIYNKILRMENKNRVVGGFGHFQQRGIQIYKPGDSIRIIEIENAETVANYTVKAAGLLSEEEVWVETNEPMPAYDDRYIIENLSANPEVEISNCECGNNRPRGFLLGSSKKMLVENCIFYNMYAGINIGSEMTDWFESGQVNDVTIRSNHFNNSAFAGASPAINIVPKVRHLDSLKHYNKGIVIENNTFTMAERRFLHAHAVDNLIFRNNKFICDENLPKHGTIGEDGVLITNCENVVYEPILSIGACKMEQIKKNTVSAENQVNWNVQMENADGKGKRILFVGNSITRHEVSEDIGWRNDWGMAASAKEKDYVHRIEAKVLEKDSDAAFCICQAADWERKYKEGEKLYPAYVLAREFHADIIVMRLIENCPLDDFDNNIFRTEYLKFIRFLNTEGRAKIILTSSFWKRMEDEVILQIAEENGWDFIYLGDLGERADMRADGLFDHSGVAHHPGDKGMEEIATRIWERMRDFL